MNNEYVEEEEEEQKWKKNLFDKENNHLALLFPGRVWDNVSPIQRTDMKEDQEWVSGTVMCYLQTHMPFSMGD